MKNGKRWFRYIAVIAIGCCFVVAVPVFAEGLDNHDGHDQTGHADIQDDAVVPAVLIKLEHEGNLQARKPAELSFLVTDRQGMPAKELTVSHDRLLHIIIISEDLSYFTHIHPEDFGPITDEMLKGARFPVRLAFPMAGRYLVAADTAVRDTHVSGKFQVTVRGEPNSGLAVTDLSREKSFGGYEVFLETLPDKIRAGEKVKLLYKITRGGGPVSELERYLGAFMHLAITTNDLNSFIHAHGDIPGSVHSHGHSGHDHGAAGKAGPDIGAEVIFPASGLYKIFSQIQHEGKIILLDFMVLVD